MRRSLNERFFLWFWRGKKQSVGEKAHKYLAGGILSWNDLCNIAMRSYYAGYRAGRRMKG
jgi:hypothetical protein